MQSEDELSSKFSVCSTFILPATVNLIASGAAIRFFHPSAADSNLPRQSANTPCLIVSSSLLNVVLQSTS